jgi:hypothetical protein
MMLSVLGALDPGPVTLFAEYEAMAADPVGQARRLAAFLNRQCATASGPGTVARWPEPAFPPTGAIAAAGSGRT